MRFLSILALSVFALTATAQSYTVTGKIDAKYNGKQMCLTEQSVVVDTVVIADGAFAFKKNIADQALCRVFIPGNRRVVADVIAYPGANVAVDFTQNPVSVADNGGLNDKRIELNKDVIIGEPIINDAVYTIKIDETYIDGVKFTDFATTSIASGIIIEPLQTKTVVITSK